MKRFMPFVFCTALLIQPVLAESPDQRHQEVEEMLKQQEIAAVVTSLAEDDDSRLTLEECLAIALEKNFQIRNSLEEIKKQRGVTFEQRSFSLPLLRAVAEYSQLQESRLATFNGQSFGNQDSWTAELELQQPLYQGGEGVARWKRANRLEDAARYEHIGVINQVIFVVRKRFYDVLLAAAQVEVQEKSVELLEEELRLERNKFEAGTVSEFNVLRAEVELANARTPLIRARNDLRIGLEELNRVLGRKHEAADSVQSAVRIAGELHFDHLVLDLPQAIDEARKKRPELRELKLLKEAADAGIDLERAGYLPRLLAFASYGGGSSRFSSSLADTDRGWRVGARIEWDIFDSFKSQGKVNQARAASQQALIALEEKTLDVEISVRRALSSLFEAQELVYASSKVLEQAEESLRLAKARFDAGAVRQLEVLDSQVALTEARTNNVEALYSFNLARAELEREMGVVPEREKDRQS